MKAGSRDPAYVSEVKGLKDRSDPLFDLRLYVKPSRDAWKKQCHRARHFNRLTITMFTRARDISGGEYKRQVTAQRKPTASLRQAQGMVFERHPCWVNNGESNRTICIIRIISQCDLVRWSRVLSLKEDRWYNLVHLQSRRSGFGMNQNDTVQQTPQSLCLKQ